MLQLIVLASIAGASAGYSSPTIANEINTAVSSASTLAKTELAYHKENELAANNEALASLFFTTVEAALEDAVGAAANFSQSPLFFDQTTSNNATDLVESSPTSLTLHSSIPDDREWLEEVESKAKSINESSEVAEKMIAAALTALEEWKNQTAATYDQIAEETKTAILAQASGHEPRGRLPPQHTPNPNELLTQPDTWRNAGYITEDTISPQVARQVISSLPLSSYRLQNDSREAALVARGRTADQMRTRRHIGFVEDSNKASVEVAMEALDPSLASSSPPETTDGIGDGPGNSYVHIDFSDPAVLSSLSLGATVAIADAADTIHKKLSAIEVLLPSLSARIRSIEDRIGQRGDSEYKSIRQLAYEALTLEAEASSKEIAVISHRVKHSVRMKVLETKSASKLQLLEEQTASLGQINAVEVDTSLTRDMHITNAEASLDCTIERVGAVFSVAALRNATQRELELVSEAADADASHEKARIMEEAKSDREQEQASLERIAITGEETRKQAVEVIRTIVSYVRNGLKHIVSTSDGKRQCILLALAAAVLVFAISSAREAISLVFAMIQRFLTTPSLIREYGRQRWYPPFGCNNQNKSNEDSFHDVVLASRTKDRIVSLAEAAQNARRHNAPYRHVILHGPPGTGKSLVAKKLAQCTEMDYAIMSGGDVGPLGADGVTQIHNIFRWAKTSRKGVLLFIDEAEAFLGNRKHSSKISEHTHNALNALLFNTGGEPRDFMLVLSTNRPQDLDAAVLDRCDEFISLPLPDAECREKLLAQYFRTFVIDEAAKANALADGIASKARTLVAKQEPFRIEIDAGVMDAEQLASQENDG
mmetsp:Transcript_11826/g.33741  ORF Transcript_11826/g.33741 Transcript_11826/m.33741 type:complete len:829 (-) Transcript_11826:2164-4650(-)|eukprot:CAMPEP_0181035640 /NCGR_PEP_ID=MMETSP1070-20121207/8430_1 /TAXON_ID=265543 /ORGANISM="Minutocellus polymorphus, Strain NH13" /LENGTH=828 /DNA_ID=CAMNT_0023113211 /DNA_START=154 /DNA_END=2640 /DNA_ORIENTATION=-